MSFSLLNNTKKRWAKQRRGSHKNGNKPGVEYLQKSIIFFVATLLIFCCATSPRKVRKARKGVYHQVGKGETLWRIAKTYKISLKELQRVNRIKDPTKIKARDMIFIPRAKRIRKIRVVSPPVKTAKKPRKKPTKKKRAPPRFRKKKRAKKPSKSKTSFRWPVKGKISSRFGSRRKGQRHDGIDISASKGTPIYAAKSGKVIYSDNRLRHYGNTIILKHDGGWFTVYAHNKKNLVSVGKWVKQGVKIAEVGNSGQSSKPRLHFEIRGKEKPVDPLVYLPRR